MQTAELLEDLHKILNLFRSGEPGPAEKKRQHFDRQQKINKLSQLAHDQEKRANEFHTAAKKARDQNHPLADKIQRNADQATHYALKGHHNAAEIAKSAGDHNVATQHQKAYSDLAARHAAHVGNHAQVGPEQHNPFQPKDSEPHPAPKPAPVAGPKRKFPGVGGSTIDKHKKVAQALGKKYARTNPAQKHLANVQNAYSKPGRKFEPKKPGGLPALPMVSKRD